MARPRLSPDKRLSERVVTYITPSELLRGLDRADAAGLSHAAYAREKYVHGRVVVKQYRQLDHSIVDQVRRIGVNLNQLTHLAHIKKSLPSALSRACREVEQFLIEHINESPRKP